MRLRLVFTVQTAVFLLKKTFEFMFNGARSTLYRSCRRECYGKIFNNMILTNSLVCPMWPACNEVARRVGGLEFDFGHNLFLFASFFFFFFWSSFPFSYCNFVLFLYKA